MDNKEFTSQLYDYALSIARGSSSTISMGDKGAFLKALSVLTPRALWEIGFIAPYYAIGELAKELPVVETPAFYSRIDSSRFYNVDRIDAYFQNTGTFKYPLNYVDASDFFNSANIQVSAPPNIYTFDFSTNSCLVFPMISQVVLRQYGPLRMFDETSGVILSEVVREFMQEAVAYELAYRICVQFDLPWSDFKEQHRLELQRRLKQRNRNSVYSKGSVPIVGSPSKAFSPFNLGFNPR